MQTSEAWITLIYTLLRLSAGDDFHLRMLYSKHPFYSECFFIDVRYYCRSMSLRNNTVLCENGDPLTFIKLRNFKITSENLINWLIPFDVIEQYTAYLDSDENIVEAGLMICNCSQNQIGRKCEYFFNSKMSSPANVLTSQMGSTDSNSYEMLTRFVDGMVCKSADLFLEWRHICDGLTQCLNGADEVDCHILEFHKCELDEFQCRNGMCIPIEFAFDAMPDCMDGSDEQELDELYKRYYDCSKKSTYDCDDRLCRKDQFSCGNGECVPWSSVLTDSKGCSNYRHVAYICETSNLFMGIDSDGFGICKETLKSTLPLTNISDCLQSLRYLLKALASNRLIGLAISHIKARCEELIPYSDQNTFFPGLNIVYNRSRIEAFYGDPSNSRKPIRRSPDLYYFSGGIMCDGVLLNVSQKFWFDLREIQEITSYPFFPLSHVLCQKVINQLSNDTATHNNQQSSILSRSYRCQNTSARMSLRRINDGYIDCLYGDDERNPYYPMTELFRYQCQTVTSPFQYVSYAKLGNGVDDCFDGSDEISKELRWSSFKCDINDNYACWVFQGDQFREKRLENARLHFHRYCDSVWDTMNGRDEMNCSQWLCDPGLYKCNRTGQCIKEKYVCDGELDCDDGEDEINCSLPWTPWDLELNCSKITEFFCLTDAYVKNQVLHRPCISRSRIGDGLIDCIGARDERNVLACPDHRMIGDRFWCENGNKCIDYKLICNGIKDCIDGKDESICYWNTGWCPLGEFSCADHRGCKSIRCTQSIACNDRSHRFWCPNKSDDNYVYRSGKDRIEIDNKKRCYSQSELPMERSMVSSSSVGQVIGRANEPSKRNFYCNRGFYLQITGSSELACFCPPTFYGDRCQFSSRRVNLRLRFDRRHRSDLPIILNVLVTLLLNGSIVVDHRFFLDEYKDNPSKTNTYLVYSRPKPSGIYSVRIEAYDLTQLIHFWEYPVSPLDFLPVLRIGKMLRFPDHPLPWPCAKNYCQNNGTCYQRENNGFLCLCSRNWKGRLCEIRSDQMYCAPHSLARTENICVCPYGYLEPHCYVENRKCQRTNCTSNEICHARSSLPLYGHICVCNTSDCSGNQPTISLYRQEPNQLPFLLQLLQLAGDYPTVRQQILIHPYTSFPLTQVIKTRDFRDQIGTRPEIGLLFAFEPNSYSIETTIHLLFINCSNTIRNFSVDLDLQLQKCHVLPENQRYSITLFPKFCQNLTYGACFISDGYLCYCGYPNKNQSNCLSYRRRYTTCNYCQNQGHCVQGDLKNRSDFACVCPKCVTGVLCQFSSNRFSISLELLIGKTNWGQGHFIGPGLFLLIGMVFNGLCIVTFIHRKLRQNGVALHLLSTSICSLLVLILLFSQVTYLYIVQQVMIEHKISTAICKSLPFLMYTFHYTSLWLIVIVTVERALAAMQYSGWTLLQKPITTTLMICIIFIITLSSNYMLITQYTLVNHPDNSFPWCIREITSNERQLTKIFSLFHQVTPFVINMVAALIIIVAISRSKAHAHQKSTRSVLADQIRQRIDLLLGPIVCFLTQLPEIVVLSLNACDYDTSNWFLQITLVTYYLSFVPHMSIFFLYVLPSKHYHDIFSKDTWLGNIFRT